MCGIAGILHFDGRPVDRDVLLAMTEIIAHRGPDSEGVWLDRALGLGHRRLSIIDLSHEADQPMISHDGKTVIVFNGEIYNYKELAKHLVSKGIKQSTQSDTEVILNLYKLYGTECLSHFRGMFAFAIWDRLRKCLFVARDRVGIKPLYFFHSQKAFVFGSEIKAIAVSGYSELRINKDALSGFLRFLVVPQPTSIFDDISKLEPGHFLLITENGDIQDKTYWTVPTSQLSECSEGEAESINSLNDILKSSIEHHMVSDVPVSAFLSGGLDSSAVVSLMREQAPDQQIDAFSMTFPGQEDYDEDKFAREVASLKHLTYHAGTIDENFIEDLELMAWHLDEPFAISSAYATFYLAKNATQKTKVVLTGDGGDELFAGYGGYTNDVYLKNELLSGFFEIAYHMSRFLSKWSEKNGRGFNRIISGLRRRSGSEGLRYSEQVAQNSWLAASVVLNHDIFLHCLHTWSENLMVQYYDQLPVRDRLQKKLYAEFKTRLVDEMLMKVDRMTMAHSLEARVPLLDHHVVEFAFKQPSKMKLRPTSEGPISKYILKKAMEKYLPNEIVYRRKQGFDIPVKNWFSGHLLNLIKERVLEGHLQKWGLVQRAGIERLIKLQSDSTHNFNTMLMLLLAFETWAESYHTRIDNITIGL